MPRPVLRTFKVACELEDAPFGALLSGDAFCSCLGTFNWRFDGLVCKKRLAL